MANISDAFGEINIEKVRQEFLDFLEVAQKDGYYLLAEDTSGLKPDDEGDISFDFFAGGRWYFGNNLNGYLGGDWMNSKEQEEAYAKLLKALKDKDGRIEIDYTDSDTAMDWMGTGVYEMYYEDGELVQSENFEEESITLEKFAELHGQSKEWALEYIFGDEAINAWYDYTDKEGDKAKDIQYWLDKVYQEE